MIPEAIWEAPLSYGWEGYASVIAFGSEAPLANYEAFYKSAGWVIEKVQDEPTCLQFQLHDPTSGARRFDVLAVDAGEEDDVLDLTSYVGEKEFPEHRISESRTIGALFEREPG